jgi:DNA polymerase-3 subunit epsilon
MTRGQETLDIMMSGSDAPSMMLSEAPVHGALVVLRASDDERATHAAQCERIEKESKGKCLWMHLAMAA